MKNKKLVLKKLIIAGIIKHGDFVLKSGKKSNVYFDFRDLAGHPELMDDICDLMAEVINKDRADLLVGLPYASLPIASVLSVKTGIPMIYSRKETKKYGTKKKIEGIYREGQNCIIVDDVVSSGLSKKDAIKELKINKLFPKYSLVIVDREESENKGLNIKSLWKKSEIIEVFDSHS